MLSPGTYLTKRREAAGLTRDELAMRLLACAVDIPVRAIPTMVGTIARAEADETHLDRLQTLALHLTRPLRFDTHVYHQLLDLHVQELGRAGAKDAGLPVPQLCRECGCGFMTPCEEGAGCYCAWSDSDPELCTACETRHATNPDRPGLRVIEGAVS